MIIIRVDDVGWTYSKKPDFGMENYSKFHKLFKERNLPYCPAVIPGICDNEMIAWMKQNFYEDVSTFIHGWIHKNITRHTTASEFGGLSFVKQKEIIYWGIETLKSLNPVGFVAPFNAYNDTTIKACAYWGLKYLLTGANSRDRKNRDPEEYRIQHGMICIPEQLDLYCTGAYDKTMEVIETVKKLEPRDYPYIVSLHCIWEYPNLAGDALPRLLDAVQKKGVMDIRSFKGVK